MLTVVLKLLCIICPTRCYFGEKDYQQYRLVKSMVEAFFLETEIVACRTIRNSKGLPLSSRNNRLSPKQFEKAQLFPHILHANRTTDDIKTTLISQGFEVDYVEDYEDRRFAAVRLGDIRLIDNIILEAL